ncbi:gas vesicle protein [Streptomyces sp. NPDC020472]|uniref:gas vesicle protein n=1 Tax=Streptomyces sp. NPDC020472 TaxID=3365075 RepID=UPI0037A7A4DD
MSDSLAGRMPGSPRAAPAYGAQGSSANLADILERVLDKGIVIAGDIQINLLDIELLTIKLRLLVASVDKAKEMGIDWWEHDPSLSSRARPTRSVTTGPAAEGESPAEENERLRAELARLRAAAGLSDPSPGAERASPREREGDAVGTGQGEEETR